MAVGVMRGRCQRDVLLVALRAAGRAVLRAAFLVAGLALAFDALPLAADAAPACELALCAMSCMALWAMCWN